MPAGIQCCSCRRSHAWRSLLLIGPGTATANRLRNRVSPQFEAGWCSASLKGLNTGPRRLLNYGYHDRNNPSRVPRRQSCHRYRTSNRAISPLRYFPVGCGRLHRRSALAGMNDAFGVCSIPGCRGWGFPPSWDFTEIQLSWEQGEPCRRESLRYAL